MGNQQNSLSTMEHGRVEIGTEILLCIGREFGKRIDWLLTGKVRQKQMRRAMLERLQARRDRRTNLGTKLQSQEDL